MSKKYIGGTLDIHAGGEDLVFPHHENEIAQSEAANGTTFANYWMHNGFLKIDNEKMSKSLGNFFTVREICEKYDPQVIRFFMLSAQYRSPLNFADTLVEAAKNGLDRIHNAARDLSDKAAGVDGTGASAETREQLESIIKRFDDAMDDDLNTADAISVLFELVKYANQTRETAAPQDAAAMLDTLSTLADVLGIHALPEEDGMLDSDIEALIEERNAARKEKNFARADEIRNLLEQKGILLKDTREGVKWQRI